MSVPGVDMANHSHNPNATVKYATAIAVDTSTRSVLLLGLHLTSRSDVILTLSLKV